jgi:hypothetical protein
MVQWRVGVISEIYFHQEKRYTYEKFTEKYEITNK